MKRLLCIIIVALSFIFGAPIQGKVSAESESLYAHRSKRKYHRNRSRKVYRHKKRHHRRHKVYRHKKRHHRRHKVYRHKKRHHRRHKTVYRTRTVYKTKKVYRRPARHNHGCFIETARKSYEEAKSE